MDDSIRSRLRRAARGRHEEPADSPSQLRRALADLGRVIAEPIGPGAGPAPAPAGSEP